MAESWRAVVGATRARKPIQFQSDYPAEAEAALAGNWAAARRIGVRSSPTFLWRGPDGAAPALAALVGAEAAVAEEKGRLRTLGGYVAKPFVAYGRYTKAAFGTEQVKANRRNIGLLWDAVRGRHEAPPQPAAPLHALNLRTPRVQAALWQTAWACRIYTAMAGSVFWAWTAEALASGRWAGPFTALMALLVVGALGLKAFAEALANWRLRTGLPGEPGAFLAWEGGPLWPPMPERPTQPTG